LFVPLEGLVEAPVLAPPPLVPVGDELPLLLPLEAASPVSVLPGGLLDAVGVLLPHAPRSKKAATP
jgi:hypothetical protein